MACVIPLQLIAVVEFAESAWAFPRRLGLPPVLQSPNTSERYLQLVETLQQARGHVTVSVVERLRCPSGLRNLADCDDACRQETEQSVQAYIGLPSTAENLDTVRLTTYA